MKRALSIFAVLTCFATSVQSDPATPVAAAFERLKTMAGEWHGTNEKGEAVRSVIRLTAGGTAVMEEFSFVGKPDHDMLTVYHLDGARLLLTHYCMADNQPRMQAKVASDGSTLAFEMIDATNLASNDDGHMHRAVIELVSDDEMRQAWTFRKDGEDAFTEAVTYTRKR